MFIPMNRRTVEQGRGKWPQRTLKSTSSVFQLLTGWWRHKVKPGGNVCRCEHSMGPWGLLCSYKCECLTAMSLGLCFRYPFSCFLFFNKGVIDETSFFPLLAKICVSTWSTKIVLRIQYKKVVWSLRFRSSFVSYQPWSLNSPMVSLLSLLR